MNDKLPVKTTDDMTIAIGSQQNASLLFDFIQGEINAALPSHISKDVLLKAALNSCRKNPALLTCTRLSMLSALMFCAESGLMPDTPTQECHLIPFKVKGVMTVTWIAGYRGLIKLARQSGEIAHVVAHAVYEGDTFKYQLGDEPHIFHEPDIENPERITKDKLRFTYAIATYKDGSIPKDFEVMTKGEIDKIRGNSRAKDALAWTYHYAEQGKKTVIRRLSKRLPMSPQLALAVDLDNKAAVGDRVVHDTVAEIADKAAKTPTENLADDLSKKAGIEPEPEKQSEPKKKKAEPKPKKQPEATVDPSLPPEPPETKPEVKETPTEPPPPVKTPEDFSKLLSTYRNQIGEDQYTDLHAKYGPRRLKTWTPEALAMEFTAFEGRVMELVSAASKAEKTD